MDTARRQELVERLLGVLLEFIQFPLPDETRTALLEEPTGSWIIPQQQQQQHDAIITTIITADNNIIVWKKPSLYWMWQEDTGGCCLNFLAKEGIFPWGSMEAFQWTLEAFSEEPGGGHGGSQRELRRFEPMILTSDYNNNVSSSMPTMTPIQSFWKIASFKITCVEFTMVTLMGMLSKKDSSSSSNDWKLNPQAVFSCDKVALSGHDRLPSSSNEHVQVAKVVGMLDEWKTPRLVWRSPPLGRREPLESFTVDSLADVFRRAYTFLEDDERSRARNGTVLSTSSGTFSENDAQSLPRRETSSDAPPPAAAAAAASPVYGGFDLKKSISDSLIMTGGLAATGASFVTPMGAAVSVAALGVKDGVAAAARKGKDCRKGDGYKFGDVTRGIVSTIKEKQSPRIQRPTDDDMISSGNPNASTIRSSNPGDTHSYLEANKSRYMGVVGSSVGAAVGLTLVGGPLGLLAGSLAGGIATQKAISSTTSTSQGETDGMHAHDDESSAARCTSIPTITTHSDDDEFLLQLERKEQRPTNGTKSWKFGDNIRNVVNKGKEAAGRDADTGYKPGDFTRGLFSRENKHPT